MDIDEALALVELVRAALPQGATVLPVVENVDGQGAGRVYSVYAKAPALGINVYLGDEYHARERLAAFGVELKGGK